MGQPFDIDHPAAGAGHVFIPGSADSIVAASRLTATAPWPVWVTVGREHRLPHLLERPITEGATEIWCLGYSGTGNALLTAALEAHVTHRPVRWLSTTTGRLRLAASELAGIRLESMPGGSLVNLVLRDRRGRWTPDDHASERLGYILGRYPGWRPTARELTLANRLHAASVTVRNHEGHGAPLVRALAGTPVTEWGSNEVLADKADAGEQMIRDGRQALADTVPLHGSESGGPALWLMSRGSIKRGVHGKAVAAAGWRRKSPVALIEEADRGFTKAWVVLPARRENLWVRVAETFGEFSADFSWTGRRGAGAIHSAEVETFRKKLWTVLRSR
ncbi:MAG: hypothetical protein KDA24_23635 [Deltaproteobacteria bacterium]|nr:hypothetical protein [Deltaproteobacteria bacterium]